jgi:hypothetical protein
MSKSRILIAAALAAAFSALPAHAHAVGSLADLTVFDRTQNVRLPVHWHEGRAYVAGKPGNEYTLSIRSRQGAEVLAVVSVDGVNVITGEGANPQQSGYVLSPYRSLDIKGWRKNMAETAAFYFTSLGDSYAARTGRPNDVGVIGVAVFRKKPELPPQPISQIAPRQKNEARRDAPAPFSGAGASADSASAPSESRASGELSSRSQPSAGAPIGTGHGRREASHARHVGFERASADSAETITLYYDSRANLLARGVIREYVPIAPRQPNPFPGFVPDPVSVVHPLEAQRYSGS